MRGGRDDEGDRRGYLNLAARRLFPRIPPRPAAELQPLDISPSGHSQTNVHCWHFNWPCVCVCVCRGDDVGVVIINKSHLYFIDLLSS